MILLVLGGRSTSAVSKAQTRPQQRLNYAPSMQQPHSRAVRMQHVRQHVGPGRFGNPLYTALPHNVLRRIRTHLTYGVDVVPLQVRLGGLPRNAGLGGQLIASKEDHEHGTAGEFRVVGGPDHVDEGVTVGLVHDGRPARLQFLYVKAHRLKRPSRGPTPAREPRPHVLRKWGPPEGWYRGMAVGCVLGTGAMPVCVAACHKGGVRLLAGTSALIQRTQLCFVQAGLWAVCGCRCTWRGAGVCHKRPVCRWLVACWGRGQVRGVAIW